MSNRELTIRQKEIIGLIGRFRFLNTKLLENYYGLTKRSVYMLSLRLRERGYIRVEKIFNNGDNYLLLENLGSDLAGCKCISKINSATLLHDTYVHYLAVDELKNGNEIKLEYEAKEELNLKFTQINKIILPDLLINNEIAVEVELSLKMGKKLLNKINKYNLDDSIKEIKWFSNNKLILNRLYNLSKNPKHKYYIFKNNILDNIECNFTKLSKFKIVEFENFI